MRFRPLFLLAVFLLAGAAATVRAAQAEPVVLANRVVAIVADSIITLQQVQEGELPFIDNIAATYGNGTLAFRQQMASLEGNVITNLVAHQLILHDYQATGFNIPETIIDEYIQDVIRGKYGTDRISFNKDLQSRGMTFEEFRKNERDKLIINEMTRKFVPEPIISPQKVQDYYLKHREQSYKVGDEVKTRVIILNQSSAAEPGSAARLAREIRSQIQNGVPFEEMARIHSSGPQRADGGENGWQELTNMNSALVAPITMLKPGECSDVIETPTACFLIQLEERRPAHFRPLIEVREEIEHTLAGQEKERQFEQWIGRLRAKTFVRFVT